MAFNLRNRNFLKLLDFTHRTTQTDGQEHRPDFRKDLDPHPLRFRSRRQGPRRSRHLPRPHWLTNRHQGIDG